MRAPELKLIVRVVLVFAVLALTGILAAINYHFQREARDLVEAGNRVEAVISTKSCANAGLVYYTFAVAGSEYRGSSNACVAACVKAQIGEKVQVTYSAKNPQNSICGSAERVASRFDGNYMGLGLIVIGLLVVVFRTTRRELRVASVHSNSAE